MLGFLVNRKMVVVMGIIFCRLVVVVVAPGPPRGGGTLRRRAAAPLRQSPPECSEGQPRPLLLGEPLPELGAPLRARRAALPPQLLLDLRAAIGEPTKLHPGSLNSQKSHKKFKNL